MRAIDTTEAVQMLDLLSEYFADGRHWTRGRFYSHGRHCLVGALNYLRREHRVASGAAKARAAREERASRIAQEIRRIEPEVKTVERTLADVAQKKRVLAALRTMQDGRIQALPFMRDLTNLVPQDAWLQALSMDRQGVEITGQANAASQLIPLLEASPWLERVEFTSPVTKGQDKEQFRIRAAWEPGPKDREP